MMMARCIKQREHKGRKSSGEMVSSCKNGENCRYKTNGCCFFFHKTDDPVEKRFLQLERKLARANFIRRQPKSAAPPIPALSSSCIDEAVSFLDSTNPLRIPCAFSVATCWPLFNFD